jgi:hypothetical protein
MSQLPHKFLDDQVRAIYLDASNPNFAKAWSQYSFEYKIDGVAYRVCCDLQNKSLKFQCTDKAVGLFTLVKKMEHLICKSKLELDGRDIYEFIWKHFQAMAKVEQEFQLIEALDRCDETLNPNAAVKAKTKGVPQQSK